MITLILLSHNNPNHLKRVLLFYKQRSFKGRIVIADSSNSSESSQAKDVVDAVKSDLFCPFFYSFSKNETYIEKILYVLQKTLTPYVLLAGVDDFYSPTAIHESLVFLRKNKDYVFCYGHYYGFTFNKNELKMYYTAECDNPRSYDQENPLERVDSFLSLYSATLYSVFRTDVLGAMFKDLHIYASSPELKFFENMFTILALLYGKGKFLEIPFSWREMSEHSHGVSGHQKWLLDGEFPQNVALMEAGLVYNLKRHLYFDQIGAEREAKRMIQKFLEMSYFTVFYFSPHKMPWYKSFFYSLGCADFVKTKRNQLKKYFLSAGQEYLYDKKSLYFMEFSLVKKMVQDSGILAVRSGMNEFKRI